MKLGPFDLNETHCGDALDSLRQLPDSCVHCVITSPPYWNLRSYLPSDDVGKELEIGSEPTPELFVERLVEVFREVRRVLRDDGTLWLNLGDSYAATGKSGGGKQGAKWEECGAQTEGPRGGKWSPAPPGLKSKDLCLIPYRAALALQADGWYLRSNIVWAKGVSFCEHFSGSTMPDSARDRPASAHESMFLFAKSKRYHYDLDAVREGANERNIRNVWAIGTGQFEGSHYAVFPPQLVIPCVKAGCPPDGIVLDPFMGSGTTAQVAQDYGRQWLGFDLDKRNLELVNRRTRQRSLLSLMSRSIA